MYSTIKVLILAIALFSFADAHANNNAQMQNMAKQMSSQLKMQLEAQMEMMSDPKMLKAQAKYLKSFYEALVEEGFRKDQAMKIVIASVSGKKG